MAVQLVQRGEALLDAFLEGDVGGGGELLDGGPIAVTPCEPGPITLPAGKQELLISPGAAFVTDGARLTGPLGAEIPGAPTTPVETGAWQPAHRELQVPPSPVSRVAVVPESINPGWRATTADGRVLTPVPVNGWQQGWLIPPGTAGTVTLTFPSNTWYRAGLAGGLALLPLLLLLALLPARRAPPDEAVPTWSPRPDAAQLSLAEPHRSPSGPRWWAAGAAVLAGGLISGVVGALLVGAAVAVLHLLRGRPRAEKAVTLGLVSGGLTLAGAVLSRFPWRSVDGYAGHSAGVQFLALVSLAVLAASVCTTDVNATPPPDRRP